MEPSRETSSAPPSAAARVTSSSSAPSAETITTPRRSNSHETAPEVPRFPSFFSKAWRTSEAVRLRLSVSASTITATPLGPKPSYTTVSKACASESAPDPRAIARSMLSFGIEYDRAFSIAFCKARFPAGSGPPSFAATMIARESLEKSLPRFASAAPFLCLIEDHLLCPDTHRLLYGVEKQLVHACIFRQLGMERGDEETPLACEHRPALVLGQDLDFRPRFADTRRADEDPAERRVLSGEREIRLEAGDLAAVGVSVDREVDEPEMVTVEHDHPGTGTQDRFLEP